MNAKLITSLTAAAFALFAHSVDAQTIPVKSSKVKDVTIPSLRDVYTSIEVLPSFPGGFEELMKFLVKNIDPSKTAEQGRINVTFIVERNGSLHNIQAIGIDDKSKAAKEVIRVMKSSPKWKPGKQDGKPVRVQSSLPINLNYQSL